MRPVTRNILVLMLGVVLGVVLAPGTSVRAERDNQAPLGLPTEELHTLAEVFGKIKSDYVEPVGDRQLLEYAIRGMLAGLDPHSAFLDEEAYKDLQVGTTGKFGGLGIEVGLEDGFVKVISPIDDTPAQKAGVKAGDLIIRLDDKPVKGMSLSDAVDIMRGKPGTRITLSIVREGATEPLEISITRAIINVKSVKSRMLEPGFGYLRVTQFQADTSRAVTEAVSALKRENGGELRGMVLDLRNNPGGVLNAAVGVSDAFLKDGLIVYTEGRVKDSRLRYKAKPDDALNGAPMVVLVNDGSASAAEIVAGALQDHKRAVIMGRKTFGKGSVQTILPMADNSAVKLTTARYFTPKGRSIQAEGIQPDIELEELKVALEQGSSITRVKEADLSNHLSNGSSSPKPKEIPDKRTVQPEKVEGKKGSLAGDDYELYEALNLLKGLSFVSMKAE